MEFYKIKFDGSWYTRLFGKFVLKAQPDFGFLGTYNKNITPSRNQVLGEVKTDSTDGKVGMDSSNVDRINNTDNNLILIEYCCYMYILTTQKNVNNSKKKE